MNNLEKLFEKCTSAKEFSRGYLNYLTTVLNNINDLQLEDLIHEFIATRERNGRIIFVGNGGSASTASHFANDLGIGTRSFKKPFQTLSLTDNISMITAIANDYGYENIFLQQMQNHAVNQKDTLVAISVSGNSPSVLKACEFAKECGAKVVCLTGFDGGKMKSLADVNVHIQTEKGEYGPAEDAHMVIDHLVFAYLKSWIQRHE